MLKVTYVLKSFAGFGSQCRDLNLVHEVPHISRKDSCVMSKVKVDYHSGPFWP